MPHPAPETGPDTAEHARLREEAARQKNWKRWGPYLAERQWGTVREDYSADGDCWNFFPHDHARSRAYRWGEDGLLGFCDRQCRLCLSVALWNGNDPILKERLFGLTGPEGNHAEDVKEQYWYLDSTPTHSYAKAAYRYPQAAFPYDELVAENARRTKQDLEYELADTGVFDDGRYFDVVAEYAKVDDNDVLMRVSVTNHGPEPASLHVLPTLWFRNTWVWGCEHEGCSMRPDLRIDPRNSAAVRTDHETLGRFTWAAGGHPETGERPDIWFTENLTNTEKLFGTPSLGRHTKDAFDRRLVHGETLATNPREFGTKAAAVYRLELQPGETKTLRTRLFQTPEGETSTPEDLVQPDAFDAVFTQRLAEADAFYDAVIPAHVPDDQSNVTRQAYAGLLWTKQFYHYIIEAWLDGDPKTPPPPEARKTGRNHDWPHLFARDILSMPDKWEYPWFAAWDTAFHMIPFCRVDPQFAKDQLELFLREWYLHPNGQIPAYEFAFGDVNPPVHAWAVWRVYKMTAPRGQRDRRFLASCFQKLLLNFTWWVNRKDPNGNHLFAGGFLGLDNIGVFDRSRPLPGGHTLVQADATAWMAFYCNTMLSMALELADTDRDVPEARAYADMASKFFEHFVAIADAINGLGGDGLWDEGDGIYYDQLQQPDGEASQPIRVRSLVGLMPLIAAEVFPRPRIDRLPGFRKRMDWFLENRPELAGRIAFMDADCDDEPDREDLLLLALPSRDRLRRVLGYLLDEDEFLGPFGVRSVSKHHEDHPFTLHLDGQAMSVAYTPGESDTHMFGGNSNWRGPVWFPINYLLIEALQRYHHFYGDTFTVECPTGSGNHVTLDEAAREIERRLIRLCPADDAGRVLFYEYFHGDTGRGLGASHQTGWTALVARCIEDTPPRKCPGSDHG
ncbi:MAG: glucosidase [Planctomycetota bacterium]